MPRGARSGNAGFRLFSDVRDKIYRACHRICRRLDLLARLVGYGCFGISVGGAADEKVVSRCRRLDMVFDFRSAAFFSLNALSAKAFGESEFWLSGIKIIVILLFIILGGGAMFGFIDMKDGQAAPFFSI